MVVEGFGGCLPTEALARASVEGGSDRLDILRRPPGKVSALREVLAQQAVRVLVGAALPGTVRVGEVDRDAGLDRELGVC
jgi:hypothetical protein